MAIVSARERDAAIPASELARLKARDQQAWTALFEATHELVYRAALSQVGDPHLAEDVMAQVYLEAFRGISRYRDRGRPITAWLLAIARHRSLDAVRRRRRERRWWVRLVRGRTEPEAPEAEGVGSASLLHPAFATLTPEQREVLHLRFVEDLSIEEIALLTGRSANAVRQMQFRALRRLRAALSEGRAGAATGGKECEHNADER